MLSSRQQRMNKVLPKACHDSCLEWSWCQLEKKNSSNLTFSLAPRWSLNGRHFEIWWLEDLNTEVTKKPLTTMIRPFLHGFLLKPQAYRDLLAYQKMQERSYHKCHCYTIRAWEDGFLLKYRIRTLMSETNTNSLRSRHKEFWGNSKSHLFYVYEN